MPGPLFNDLSAGVTYFDNWGRPSPAYQRYWQGVRQGIEGALAAVQAQVALINQVVNDLAIQQDMIVDILDTVGDQQTTLDALVTLIFTQTTFGYVTEAPNGSGDVSIDFPQVDFTPGLQNCSVEPAGTTFVQPQLISVTGGLAGSGVLVARLFDAAGNPITSGSYPLKFRVSRQG